MDGAGSTRITDLLKRIEVGDVSAQNELAMLVRTRLKRIAANRLRRERPDHLYQTSDLVQEAYLRLFRIRNIEWENSAHFFKVAAMQMRRILVEYARRRRPGGLDKVQLDEVPGLAICVYPDLLKVNEILIDLAEIDDRYSTIVELKYFGGFNLEEISKITGIPVGSVKRYWTAAKAFIRLNLDV